MPGYSRDPVSVRFDGGARKVLERAYARPGVWIATRITDPTPRQVAWLRLHGISWRGPDNPSAQGGSGLNARDRWTRGFVRAVYFQHKWYSGGGTRPWRAQRRGTPRYSGALQIEVGRRVPARGVIPSGRAIRIRLLKGGMAKERAVEAIPAQRRWAAGRKGEREAGPRWSDPTARDW